MSLPQVELMCADCAVTVYPKAGDGSAPKSKHEFRDMSAEEIESKRQEWQERYGNGRHIIRVNL